MILPRFTEPEDLEGIEGLAVGTMSAGLATVSASQTYLDMSAGNRVFTSLYPGDEINLRLEFGSQVPGWGHVAERAEEAPAEIVPGLMATTLLDGGTAVRAQSLIGTAAVIAADEAGHVDRVPPGECQLEPCPGLAVVEAFPEQLRLMIEDMRPDDLVIAIERAPPEARGVLAVGVAGRGYEGNLTSDTTRTPGFVLATDVAPTVLEHLGYAVPEEMSGHRIRSEGERDVGAVQERSERMRVVSGRRGAVVLRNLMAWALLAGLVTLLTRGRLGRPAFALFGLAAVYLPALLLVTAAIRPEEVLTERLIVALGAPALGAVTYALVRGWGALAIACAVTLVAYAVDVIAGSPLTAQSLLGPNPGLGVRFFGIGNELESILAVVIPVGVGAGLSAAAGAGRRVSARAAVVAFLGVGAACAFVFAAGRFGADVGAAIVFPAGAAVASLLVPGVAERLRGRRLALVAVVAAPVLGLAALFAIDMALGGDAHLSRSVLDAGGAGELADVVERRLRLAASSFGRGVQTQLFWFCVLSVIVAVWQRERILAWLSASPLARAGYAGAAAATVLGVLANDSAATFFTVGTIGLLACLAFAWSQRKTVTADTE